MKNFSLSLYAFHLCQLLDDPPDSRNPEADRLWESLVKLGKTLKFPELEALKSQLISYSYISDGNYQFTPQREEQNNNEWLTPHGREIEFTSIATQTGLRLAGNLQPFRLHDTYCVDLTLNPESEDLDVQITDIPCFQPYDLIKKVDADLGKFLWLFGETKSRKLQEIAEKWAVSFCGNTDLKPHLVGDGKLLHTDSFLYETKEITILISFGHPNKIEAIRKAAGENYDWFRDLIWSRQKVRFVYGEAQECYQKSRAIYSELETTIKTFKNILSQDRGRIKQLDELLQKIPQNLLDYNCYLRDLKAHQTTLSVNAKNFRTCLTHVLQPEDNFKIWTDFAEKTCPHYLTQIETYINYLEPGKDLFTNLTDTIRATVEIEQAKLDRKRQRIEKRREHNEKQRYEERKEKAENERKRQKDADDKLQDNIHAIGVGIASGAIIASSSGLLSTQPISLPWQEKAGDRLHPFTLVVLGSLFIAFVVWGVTKGGLSWWRSRNESDT